MLEMASIVPQNYLNLTSEAKMHMALAHLIAEPGYEQYTEFFMYRKQDAFCILDNGVIEGSPMPIETILDKAEIIKANEIVLPDAYKDKNKTIDMVDDAMRKIADRFEGEPIKPFNIMVVPQGDSMDSWLICAEHIINKWGHCIDTIGIPKHLIDTCGERDARLLAISNLADLNPNISQFNIHLLGCWKTPLEVLTIAKASEQGIIPRVRSCDSAIAYVYARNGLRFSDDDRPDKDPIDFKLGHCNETLLLYNMCAWVSIGDPSAERGVWFL